MSDLVSPVKSNRLLHTTAHATANAALVGLWLWLFRPVYPYLAVIFTRQEFRTNQIVLLAALGLIALQVRRGDLHILSIDTPRPRLWPLALALGSAVAFVFAERWLDINTLSATLFALGTYGLLGLWLRPSYWRSGLPAALLLAGALPFGEHMQTFAGYPLRLATARLVSAGLSTLGAPNLSAETILVFENGVAQVDNPCSGIKSLWTGGLFLLAATWIERRPINARWVLAALGFALLLLAANAARVALLVATGVALQSELAAEMMHVPLGVIGFLGACAAGLVLLPQPRSVIEEPVVDHGGGSLTTVDGATVYGAADSRPWSAVRRRWSNYFIPALGLALLILILVSGPGAQPVSAAPQLYLSPENLPNGLELKSWPLLPSEVDWLNQGSLPDQVSGERWRFNWQGQQGSLLLVTSIDWRAHHRPERCFTVYGLEVQASRLDLAASGFPVRLLTLGLPGREALHSAAYWLQSADGRVTEEYAARIWDDLSIDPQPWVLVTVMYDEPVDMRADLSRQLLVALRGSIQTAQGGK